MVLESICREYLNCTREINHVRDDGREPTLNDMVFYLRKVGIITNSCIYDYIVNRCKVHVRICL